jgi:hypothetical protein
MAASTRDRQAERDVALQSAMLHCHASFDSSSHGAAPSESDRSGARGGGGAMGHHSAASQASDEFGIVMDRL